MRAAAILGLGCCPKSLNPFRSDDAIEWRMGMPASANDVDAILLFGGDGTIHRHLGQLVKLGLPVLIVPAGSGNDFARALGLKNIRDSVTAWKKFCAGSGNVRPIDLGVITPLDEGSTRNSVHGSRYFCCVAGIGLDAEVARRANNLPRWLRGHGGYALSLLPTIMNMAPFPLKIFTPGDDSNDKNWSPSSDQPTILAAFANTPVYGGGMKIAPHAQMDDGLLDVCVIGAVDPFKLFCMFPTVYSGHHLKIKEVKYFSISRARIETTRPLDVYADGEFACRTPVELSVEHNAIRVITL